MKQEIFDINKTPLWPTTKASRLADGRVRGVDGSVWMYRALPLTPVLDAKTSSLRSAAATPLASAIEELARTTTIPMKRRSMARGNYREAHLLVVNIPRWYRPDWDHPLFDWLDKMHGRQQRRTQRRVAVLGVKIRERVGGSGGIKEAINSVATTLLEGGVPLADYDEDSAKVAKILDRVGLQPMSIDDESLANSWWNFGKSPDVPTVLHADHSHFFTSTDAVRMARDSSLSDCSEWHFSGQHAITFATAEMAEDIGHISVEDTRASWISHLLDSRALSVSVRFLIEPAKVTTEELARQRKGYIEDIAERQREGKLSRADQEQTLNELAQTENLYRTGQGAPTLTSTSVIVAIDGKVDDVESVMPAWWPFNLTVMDHRQETALAEMMLCSHIRATPKIMDLPAHVVTHAGAGGLSSVGEATGVLNGFTERDRQPNYYDPQAASMGDLHPISLVAGATGSGKASPLTTPIPTPAGTTLLADLEQGDWVLGSNGRPCRVETLWPVNDKPDLYRLTFSDGQNSIADFEHQWLVSDHYGRSAPRKTKRKTAIANWEAAQAFVSDLNTWAETQTSRDMTLVELLGILKSQYADTEYETYAGWEEVSGLVAALDMVDCPYSIESRAITRSFAEREIKKLHPVWTWPLVDTVEKLAERWERDKGRWHETSAVKAAGARQLLSTLDAQGGRRESMPTIIGLLNECHAGIKLSLGSELRKAARLAGVEPIREMREVVSPRERNSYATRRPKRIYDLPVALKALAVRVAEQYYTKPLTETVLKRMTTGEMLASGVTLAPGHSQFAVPVVAPLELPEANLPVGPYALGAWLGDGARHNGFIYSIDDQIVDNIVLDSYPITRKARGCSNHPNFFVYTFKDFKKCLWELFDTKPSHAIAEKYVPTLYLRASYQQRLAVLQGLMDTDGTIDRNGACELSLSDKRLALSALELIRSLGIKASISPDQPAGYRDSDGNYVVTKDRHRIHFTTDVPVFRLERKLARLPRNLRETQKWIYITSIDKIEPDDPDYGPARCITVDSPDRTYLCGDGFVVTSNTMVLLNMGEQIARLGVPVITIDPKQESDHDDVVMSTGIGHVASLDSLLSSDGILDPVRFSDPETAVERASSVLFNADPWGGDRRSLETPLRKALAYGIRQGAKSTGTALLIARDSGMTLPQGMIDAVVDLADTSPMFRAICGMSDSDLSIRANKGWTLIKVGSASFELPPMGVPRSDLSSTQRVTLEVIRMMVWGSASALAAAGGGVLQLDEAWTFLLAGKADLDAAGRLGRSQNVTIQLYTQKVSDAEAAGMGEYISRSIVLPMNSESEAIAACNLSGVQPTPGRIKRLTALPTMSSSTGVGAAPNWNSMRALRDPQTGKVIRGTIGIVTDMMERAVPVEFVFNPDWLFMASTNPMDIRVRAIMKSYGWRPGQPVQADMLAKARAVASGVGET